MDTCAIVYSELNPKRFSEKARMALKSPDSEIYISSISVGEIACIDKKRIKLSKHWRVWLKETVNVNGWQVLPVDYEVMEEAYSLPEPFHRDPVDRILVATSRLNNLPLITNDRLISEYPYVTVFWN